MPKPRRVQVTPELVHARPGDPDRHVDLSSLFAAPNVQALNIALAAMAPNPFQPRQEFTPQQLEELAEGMRAHGFLGTLLARPGAGRRGALPTRLWRAAAAGQPAGRAARRSR